MELNKIYLGDALSIIKTWPDNFVQTCVTSPPYWGLRDYGVEGQVGLEETPEEFINKLTNIFKEVKRVLRDDGTLWLNIGDSYNSSPAGKNPGGFQGKQMRENPDYDKAQSRLRIKGKQIGDIKVKDLVGIPWMLAFALRKDGWYLRSDIIWAKNSMPEGVTDRPTHAHEYVFLMSKKSNYFYDADAIGEETEVIFHGSSSGKSLDNKDRTDGGRSQVESFKKKNKRTIWTINTQPYGESHFAAFPEKLIEPCIMAGTSEKGCCPKCLTPWFKEFSNGDFVWKPGCKCGETNTVACTVLDPFMGSGTTAFVARHLSRNYIGTELNPEYHKLIDKRLQQQVMF